MNTSTCACGCGSTSQLCDHGTLERPRYYARQLITPVELTLEQQYFRDKLRRHNRLLHGWGVVCGAQVCLVVDDTTRGFLPWTVSVQPGYVLGPYGDEILIDQAKTIDLRAAGGAGGGNGCDDSPQPGDPWCTEVLVKREAGPLWVAVRYQETMCRQVRVQPTGCGCDDAQCEYSRWHDGFVIGVVAPCPASHQGPPSFDNLFKGAPRPECPDCPASPWVVLARVDVDAAGAVQAIDNCSCRRLVASWSTLWWQCTQTPVGIDKVTANPDPPVVGKPFSLEVQVTPPLPAKVAADLGVGVTVTSVTVATDQRAATIAAAVASGAAPGPRPVRLEQENGCVLAFKDDAFTVAPAATTKPALPPPAKAPGPPPVEEAPPPAPAKDATPSGAPASAPAAKQQVRARTPRDKGPQNK